MKAKRFNAMEQSLRRLGMRRRLQRALWYLPAVLSLSVMLPGYALAGKRPTAEVVQQALADPGNLLLLDVVVQRVTVASSMTAYQIDDSVYVPLGELARVLTFLVQVDAAAGRARGFVLNPTLSTFPP
jgi:hypothetical protein